MRIDVLEETLARLRDEGRRPKFIYTIPNFQNPGGVTMSLERRRALVRIAAEQELVILEDNPYGLLRYEGDPLPTLYSLDGGRYVIYLGHVLEDPLRRACGSAGRRAPAPILERLNLGKQAADLCSSPLNQYFVVAYFEHRDWRTYLDELRAIYRRRRDVMLAALEEFLPRRGDLDAARRAGCSSGPSCPTTSTRPTCWRARCASTSRSSPAARRTSTGAAARRCG